MMQDGLSSGALYKIQEWYDSNCDDDWEHQFGVSLTTLDNTGWALTVDLDDTDQEHEDFEERKIKYDHERDWVVVSKDGLKLKGACGPKQLGAMLSIIADWLKLREPEA